MHKHRILIVDDDPDILLYVSTLLEDHGYEVHAAADCSAALSVVHALEPHTIVIDVMMPGRSGLDLLVHLRRDPALAHTPIVVMTGNDQILQDDCASYLGLHDGVRGPDGVLGKPMDPAALLRVVGHLCDGKRVPLPSA